MDGRFWHTGLRSLWLATALSLGMAGAAAAAPTCQDRAGQTLRCGTPGAMPVGWTLPDSERAAQTEAPVPLERIVGAVTLVACLFALIALMPPFDGRRNADWGGGDD